MRFNFRRKKLRIVSLVFLFFSFLFFGLIFTSLRFNFIEVKIPGKSKINLDKGSYTLYFINDQQKEVKKDSKNYYFELRNSNNEVIRKFPDTLNEKLISTTEYFELNNKKYSQYTEFTLNKAGEYTLESYSKNNYIIEVALRKDEHVNSRIVMFLFVSMACILLSIIIFAVSFFIK